MGLASGSSGATYGLYGQSNSTAGAGVFGWGQATSGANFGVSGRTDSETGIGVYGLAYKSSGTNCGVYGKTNSPSGFAGYFVGRSYFSDNVGIRTTNPTVTLDVGGIVRSTQGFRFPDGTTQTTAWTGDPGGEWSKNGNSLYYNDGYVGIGTSSPSERLHISDGKLVISESNQSKHSFIEVRRPDYSERGFIGLDQGGYMTIYSDEGITLDQVAAELLTRTPGTMTRGVRCTGPCSSTTVRERQRPTSSNCRPSSERKPLSN